MWFVGSGICAAYTNVFKRILVLYYMCCRSKHHRARIFTAWKSWCHETVEILTYVAANEGSTHNKPSAIGLGFTCGRKYVGIKHVDLFGFMCVCTSMVRERYAVKLLSRYAATLNRQRKPLCHAIQIHLRNNYSHPGIVV